MTDPEGVCALALQTPVGGASGHTLHTDLPYLVSLAEDRVPTDLHHHNTRCVCVCVCVSHMRDAEGRKKEASKIKQTNKAKQQQNTQGSHFSKEK